MTILSFGIEGRASLIYAWEVAVTLNLGVGVLSTPRVQDLAECVFLPLRAIVQRIATRINAPNITDVQANTIKPSHPIANFIVLRQSDNLAICFYDFVVTTGQPAKAFTPVPLDAFNRCALWGSCAVNHKVFNLSHIV
jgi:hypothetical protein